MSNYGKILLVEDDRALAQWVQEYLVEQGFEVSHIDRGDLVVNAVKRDKFDLVLLDLMLPGLDGIEVCRQLRGFSQIPIIMLTAKGDEFDEVIGLEVGANDYIIKPVRPRALLARIKTMLRNQTTSQTSEQAQTSQPQCIEHGDFVIDNKSKSARYQGTEIELSTNLFDLLWLLASNAGQVISRDTVFKTLKGREYDGMDRRFDIMVSTLRKKLNDNPQKPKKIKTVWGKGYLFVADAWH
ncbi:response regulator [Endozoicomonas sp. G2_1]|uniref:response regulator n=1 Tax=Endozoicomonas sp. G2_1 TaxID=2821091 RepID=UPI001ADB0DEC|nr:response regulator [Endozoicomonas sp. G2_1]MBO9490907.1 response regulator [Endozoicomonas sp. G2_1]